MEVEIVHHSFFKKKNIKWIYFGTSYEKLEKCLEKDNLNRISLKQEFSKTANRERENFLNWINNQRLNYKDSLLWWMNAIAEKENLDSNFYTIICHLITIINFVKKNNNLDKILIVAENFHLIKVLEENLQTKKKGNFSKMIFIEKFIYFFIAIRNYLKIIKFFIQHYFFAFITKNKNEVTPEGDCFIFHDLINSPNFNDKNTQSRYYGNFPQWLKEKKGKNTIIIPWFYKNIINKYKLYKNLRIQKAFVPEDWLNFKDYLNSISLSIKSTFMVNDKILYPNLKLKTLISHEKLINLANHKSAIFFRYEPAFIRWSKNLTKINYYDLYQNQTFEHVLRNTLKKINIKSVSIGYYYSLCSSEFMPYHSHKDEWNSKKKPDFVGCPNIFVKEMLIKQGIPKERLIVTSDLQREKVLNQEFTKKNFSKNLLIILSAYKDSNIEILGKIGKLKNYIDDDLGLKVFIRPHPLDKIENYLKKNKYKNLFHDWKITKNKLSEDLNSSYCVISMHSTVIQDAVINGNIILNLFSELKQCENSLDYLTKEYDVIKSVHENEIKIRLSDIFKDKVNLYHQEFEKIRINLKNKISEKDYNNLINL